MGGADRLKFRIAKLERTQRWGGPGLVFDTAGQLRTYVCLVLHSLTQKAHILANWNEIVPISNGRKYKSAQKVCFGRTERSQIGCNQEKSLLRQLLKRFSIGQWPAKWVWHRLKWLGGKLRRQAIGLRLRLQNPSRQLQRNWNLPGVLPTNI